MTGAEAIIKSLEREGVEYIFGYPGATIAPFYDELSRSEMKHILVRHEQHAGHAASGYARISGKPGVCVATSGPGAMNLLTAIGAAYMDSIPMIAVTGQVDSKLLGRDVFQEADITGACASITKYSYLVKDAGSIPHIFKEAFHIAGTGRPGPVLIDIPVDVQLKKADFAFPDNIELRGYRPTIKGHAGQIKRVAQALSNAESPLVCVGGGVFSSRAQDALRHFIESLNIPMVSTLMGIGAIPSSHPLNLGMVGTHGRSLANRAVGKADILLLLGARVSDRAVLLPANVSKNTKIIHIDIDPAEIGKNIDTFIPVVGDLNTVLGQLMESKPSVRAGGWHAGLMDAKASGAGGDGSAGAIASAYASGGADVITSACGDADASGGANASEGADVITSACGGDGASGGANGGAVQGEVPESGWIDPKAFVRLLSGALPDPYIYVADVGQNQLWSAANCDMREGCRFLTTGGMGTMGYSIGAAIGAKLAAPGSFSVAVCGDGSFQMSMMELATICQHNIDVKIVVMANGLLGLVREIQSKQFSGNFTAVDLSGSPDPVKIAAAYGIPGRTISSWDEAAGAIQELVGAKGPYLLACNVDPKEMSV